MEGGDVEFAGVVDFADVGNVTNDGMGGVLSGGV